MRIIFRIVDTSEVGRAHAWHSGFAAANDAIYPRTESDFFDLALDRCVWCAITDEDDIVAMSYAAVSSNQLEIEIGGLMVSAKMRGKGIGDLMMRIPLAHFLVNERPFLWRPKPTVVAHVLKDNDMPRGVIERTGFELKKSICRPGNELPGLRTHDDGNVHADEFHLQAPEGIRALANWAGDWCGELRDGTPAEIKLLDDETMADWLAALMSMAD